MPERWRGEITNKQNICAKELLFKLANNIDVSSQIREQNLIKHMQYFHFNLSSKTGETLSKGGSNQTREVKNCSIRNEINLMQV